MTTQPGWRYLLSKPGQLQSDNECHFDRKIPMTPEPFPRGEKGMITVPGIPRRVYTERSECARNDGLCVFDLFSQ